jgi:RNA polymerase sigma-70 factor (ECF subfamily)
VLVRRHQQDVFDLAYRFVRDRSLAEDMAQEAFIKSYRLLRGFRGDSAFSTWLYRVTCNVCLTELTRRKKRSEVALLPEQAHVPAHAPLPETRDAAELVWRCVARLPDRYATALTLYYLNQRSYEAIAEAMRIPLGTVKTWMHRARHQLRRLVEKELA